MTATVHLGVADAYQLAVAALAQLDMAAGDAERIARHLLDSQLRGDATGLARILLLAQNPAAGGGAAELITESPTTALIDGNGNYGFVAAEDATALAIAKARTAGVAVVGVNNHSFTGSLSYYLRAVTEANMVGIALSTLHAAEGNARVAPHGGASAVLSTNPLAIAVPTDDDPIIWDASTATMNGGRLMYHIEAGRDLDDGIGLDRDGNPTRDPKAAWTGAVRAWGGHRGSGLAVMLQLLGLLADVDVHSGEFAYLVIVIDPAAFGDPDRFRRRASRFAEVVRSSPPAAGFDRVRMPYDGSRERLAASERDGVDLPRDIFDRLTALSRGQRPEPAIAGARADGKGPEA